MKKKFYKFLFFLLLFMPVCVNAADYLLCGNDKKVPLVFGQLLSIFFVIVKILVPILLVIMSMISFIKAVASGKVDDELARVKQVSIQRIISAVIIFFIFSIVNFVINLSVSTNNSFSSCLYCLFNSDHCEQADDELAKLCPGLMSQQKDYDANCKYIGGIGDRINYADTGDTGVPDYANYGSNSSGTITESPTGEYTTWRQGSPEWGSRTYGPGATLANVGCNFTSIAIQIKRSGLPTTINPFNPGTMFDFMKPKGYLSSGGSTLYYGVFNEVAPGFEFDGQKNLSLNDTETYNILSGLLKDDKYPIVHVRSNNGKPFGTSGHYVAAIGYTDKDIIIVDPANTNCTRLFTCKPELDRSNGYLIAGKTSYWRVDR